MTNYDNPLISALLNKTDYQPPTSQVELIETHISWVILTGSFVYKLKKPVRFEFLDFSTLELRRYYCEEELRLNRRFAPNLYLEVVAITGSVNEPQIIGKGENSNREVLEYAVKMKQFSQQGLLETLADKDKLKSIHIDELSHVVANFHSKAGIADIDTDFGLPMSVKRWTDENFEQINAAISLQEVQRQLSELKNWCDKEISLRTESIQLRRKHGYVRECHGDLHLGNIAVIDARVTLFDCIEFNPQLRWIDVISEAAFVVMDLDFRGYSRFSWRFINLYCQLSGDYEGLILLRYFLVYRALVRAKVTALKIKQNNLQGSPDSETWNEFRGYLALADSWKNNARPAMILMFGLSGSGKSTLAKNLAETLGGIQIRSDVERKRLYDLEAGEVSGSDIDGGIYTADATEKTYARLEELSGKIIQAGYPVIVDASFHSADRRAAFHALAAKLDAPSVILECVASVDELRRRILKRSELGNDASEADVAVLEKQLTTRERLTPEERGNTITIDTENLPSSQKLKTTVVEALYE